MIRTLTASLLATALFLPAIPALADTGIAEARTEKSAPSQAKKGDRPSFPMKADVFSERISKRTTQAREKLGKRLDHAKLTADQKDKLRKAFEAGAANVKTAADKVGTDGTVTKDEAKSVRQVIKAERMKLREMLPKKPRGEKGSEASRPDKGERGKRRG